MPLNCVVITESTITYSTLLCDLAFVNRYGNVYILICMLIVAMLLSKVYGYCYSSLLLIYACVFNQIDWCCLVYQY